jgi:hypothetical protein
VDNLEVLVPGASINVILINSGNIKVIISISMLEELLKFTRWTRVFCGTEMYAAVACSV